MRILITGGSGFIGAYLIDELLKNEENEIVNIDIAEPLEKKHRDFWEQVDILDKEKLFYIFERFKPTHVVHLAARTDTNPESVLKDYVSNTSGTSNILAAIKNSASIDRVIITSTQFVHQRHGNPKHDEDYAPHTIYGQSKVITEKLTRDASLSSCWTIIRPTNIWGPRHPRYTKEFWRVLKSGRYIHPGKQPVVRSYGYVGSVVDQIMTILKKDPKEVNGQVFYVGDQPINLYDWVNGFALALNGKNVRTVPRFFVKNLALLGDVLGLLKVKFPITTSRYRSMTEENPVDMDKTFRILGEPKYSLREGIAETVEWLKTQGEFWNAGNK
jgi:GlcNAc-P-P-Und epimerase